ncbi:MAG: DUF1573 domain-containing protein [Planctomycetaceae bacterium]|nr:DUF1573 domain-containing protein [Planctomycetaceae bacterium]
MRLGKSLLTLWTVLVLAGNVLPAEELDWAHKMFKELEYDFGVVARGADAEHRIRIHNLYKETVTIANIGTSCGCISADVESKLVPSDAFVDLVVTLDTKNHLRQKDPNVDVRLTFDGVHFKDVRIPIHAYIRSDVVIEPGAAAFGTVDAGRGAEQRLKIKYAGRDDWNIREVRSSRDYLRATVQELHRGGGRVDYDLVVQLSPNAPQGSISDQLQLVTDDANSPLVPVKVTANVEPDIVVATPNVPLGMLSPGVEKTVKVILRGRQPFAIDTIECESPLECFKVKLPKEPKSVHILPLTVVPPETKGPLVEQFTVHIAGRPDTLSFRATGEIQ